MRREQCVIAKWMAPRSRGAVTEPARVALLSKAGAGYLPRWPDRVDGHTGPWEAQEVQSRSCACPYCVERDWTAVETMREEALHLRRIGIASTRLTDSPWQWHMVGYFGPTSAWDAGKANRGSSQIGGDETGHGTRQVDIAVPLESWLSELTTADLKNQGGSIPPRKKHVVACAAGNAGLVDVVWGGDVLCRLWDKVSTCSRDPARQARGPMR